MGFADFYFKKFSQTERKIHSPVPADLSCIITIPSFKEKNIIKALESLYFCLPTQGTTEVLVILNYPQPRENEFAEAHRNQKIEIEKWISSHIAEKLNFHILLEALPEKDAGVGLARKIVMDEALRRFNDIDNPRGIIAGFDGDCSCTPNYLQEIEKTFQNAKINGCSIHFEHPVTGLEYDSQTYEAIIFYELYLRFYIEALKFAQFPYAFHTLGSSFAVTAQMYAKQGGMNKRKAGEDFYFLHKIIPVGGFVELNTCAVFPSPRVSDRVPFGTGAAVNKILQHENFDFPTYSPEAFDALKAFFNIIPQFYKAHSFENLFHPSINEFLKEQDFLSNLRSINARCNHLSSFEKAFYNWFNGLMVLQYLNFSHEKYFEKIPISEASKSILERKGIVVNLNEIKLLEYYRELQNPLRYNFIRQR
jgi:hypothetical protein